MNTKNYGYARVSTRDQNEERQLIALREYGVTDKCLYIDKISGKDFNRPMYRRMVRKMKEGGVLVIKSIDRLGRNYEEIKEQWRMLTQDKHVEIVVLDMPLLNTQQGRDLTGTLIADIVLQLLSYVAQVEREFIRQRQAEGIAAARERGVRFGRDFKERPEQYPDCVARWRSGEMSARAAARTLGISHSTFLRWAEEQMLASG